MLEALQNTAIYNDLATYSDLGTEQKDTQRNFMKKRGSVTSRSLLSAPFRSVELFYIGIPSAYICLYTLFKLILSGLVVQQFMKLRCASFCFGAHP